MFFARTLTEPGHRSTQRGKVDRGAALRQVNGDGEEFTHTPRFAELVAKERQKSKQQQPVDKWVLLAEQLCLPALTTSDGNLGKRVLRFVAGIFAMRAEADRRERPAGDLYWGCLTYQP